MRGRENSRSMGLKVRLPRGGWHQLGTGLLDPAEEGELCTCPGCSAGRCQEQIWVFGTRGWNGGGRG